MNVHDFNDMLSARLGGSLIDVELGAKDYKVAFNLAKLTYKQKGSNNTKQLFYALTTIEGVLTYPVPVGAAVIVRVIKARDAFGLSASDPFDILFANQLMGSSSSDGSMIMFELTSQLGDSFGRYATQEALFTHDRYNDTITLHKRPVGGEVWLLEVYGALTDDEYRDILWVQNFALAESKIMLGRAYSKYSALSSPTGETSLDGLTLVAEGNEEKLGLFEEIKNFVDSMEQHGVPILTG